MKNKYLIFVTLVIILATLQACSVGSVTPSTVVPQNPTHVIENTSPAVSYNTTQAATTVEGPIGPELIDLTNPALYLTSNALAYTFDTKMRFSGNDATGAVKEVTLSMTEGTQSLPQKTQHFVVVVTGGEGSAETVIIGDLGYSVFQGICYPFSASSKDGQAASEGMPKLQKEITGQARRVITGIEVNGFIVDKYELTNENMVAQDELISAFVYVARNGGFITLFELQGRSKTDYQGLDPNQPTDVSATYNYIPMKDGSLEIAIPSSCVN